MKKILVLGGFIIGFFLLGTPSALAQPASSDSNSTRHTTPIKLPSSVVDNVEVPFKVLNYAQMKYQGHAVTQVQKVYYGSEQAYRLRVDRDDIPTDYKSYTLIYDKQWNLMKDKKMDKPAVLRQETPAPPKQDSKPPKKTEPRNTERKQEEPARSDKPVEYPGTGGSGGDDDDDPIEEPPADEDDESDIPAPRSNRR